MSKRHKHCNSLAPMAYVNDVNSQRGTHVSCLLPEMLAAIFRYLDVIDKRRAALVCVAWREANYQPSVWKGVGVLWTSLINVADNQTLVPSLVKRGILRASMNHSVALEDLARDFPNVQSLQLNFACHINEPAETATILCSMQHLTELDLRRRYRICDRDVKIISDGLKDLVSLNLSNSTCLTDAALLSISMGLKKLRRLYLDWCNQVTDKGVSYLTASDPNLDTSPPSKLEFLVMSNCCHLSDRAMLFLSTGQPSIKSLDVGHTKVSNVGLEYLATMQHLGELKLSGCRRFGNAAMRHLAGMTQLRKLDLSCGPVGDAGLDFLATGPGASSITSLDLQLCHNVSDEGMKHLVKMVNLCKLDLTRCRITDAGLANLVEGGSKITTLYVRSCDAVTDEGLRHLVKMTHLTELSVSYCDKVTKQGLVCLAEGGAQITTLDVSVCDRIGPQALEHISQCLPHLRYLYNTLGPMGRRPQ